MTSQAAPRLTDYRPSLTEERDEILAGLQAQPKRLAPKYFYDQRGSELFERICEQPEYYPTRTELALMQTCAAEIARAVGPGAAVIEFGSGSSRKISLLLRLLEAPAAYVPVEISREYLARAAAAVAREFPHITVHPVCADFTQPFELPRVAAPVARRLAFFPGSTIGNFVPDEARRILGVMRRQVGDDGALLIGVDLQKDRTRLERAYNDRAGVTAEFNLNLLARLNRELDADFDLAQFEHRAVYDEQAARIEMYLVSRRAQQVRVAGERIDFAAGEALLTEYSHKYTPHGFAAELARPAGFEVASVWTDPERLFSLQYLLAAAPARPAPDASAAPMVPDRP